MNLRTHDPYWLLKHGIIRSYPSPDKNIRAEVAIIGAGISGALTAWYLCQAGYKVVMADKRHVATGSTAATTALLQYEIDTPLRELVKKVGEKNAVRSYLLCRQAIYDLLEISKKVHCPIEIRPSFQYASYKKDTESLRAEYILRKKEGFRIKWLNENAVLEKFGFSKPGGILSEDGAEADAYALTHAILAYLTARKQLQVFDHTEIKDISHHNTGITLTTATGLRIDAGHLVIACGYESQQYLEQQVEKLQTTYAIISEPLNKKQFWYRNALIWETATPYLYLRTTEDNRVIIGGKDDDFTDPEKRDARLPQKAKALEQAFRKLFPHLNFKTDFKWAGHFAATKDGLPFIGQAGQKNTWFALGFGGNGITFSVIAGQLIRDGISGIKNPDLDIFRFSR
ncbi:NAD(P)/FAD-dependent oxidoreductase [Chitinophagaceae bacterium MMS25-I14]